MNVDFQMGVEYEMRKRFEKEENDYDWYTAPRIKVMGALLKEGVQIADCGRYPAIPVKKRDSYDPFESTRYPVQEDAFL